MSACKVVHVRSKDWAEAVKAGTAVYCGRAVPRAREVLAHVESIWANPHSIRDYLGPGVNYALARARGIIGYRHTMRGRLLYDRDWWEAELLALNGMTLGCWCKDPKLPWDDPIQCEPQHACHCDVLVELLEELKRSTHA